MGGLRRYLLVLCVGVGLATNMGFAQRANPLSSWLDALNTSIAIVPAPGPVTLDGKLDDWDLSGEMLTYDYPMFAEVRNARTAMMYDDKYLYVSVRYRDDTPMINLNDDRVNVIKDGMGTHTRGWAGDALQLRLCTDLTQPYPLPTGLVADSLSHLTMWYCTARKESQLNIARGMDYHHSKSYFADDTGVVFAAVKDGYVLEARFSWQLLNTPTIPHAGDRLPMTVQFQFGDQEGLKYAVHDLSTRPVNPYSFADCWGVGILEPTGHLVRDAVTLPQPRTAPKLLAFPLTVPTAGPVSVSLFGGKNSLVRSLLSGETRPAGEGREAWDGLDNTNAVVPAGAYTYSLLTTTGVALTPVATLPRTVTPPAPGGYAGAVAIAGNQFALLWGSPEIGATVEKGTLDGKKVWGAYFSPASGVGLAAIALDAKNVYLARGNRVLLLEGATGQPAAFAGGATGIDLPTGPVTALAVRGDLLYALASGNLAVVSLKQGKMLRVVPLAEGAQGLALLPGSGQLAFVCADGVRVYSPVDDRVRPLVTATFGAPVAVAVAPDGKAVFVVDRGPAANMVRAFTLPTGLPIGGVGQPGGRLSTGRLDLDALSHPGGLAFDAKGRLWVSEDDGTPRRLSTWLPTGKNGRLLAEYFCGSDYRDAAESSADTPDAFNVHGRPWHVDLSDGAVQAEARVTPTETPSMPHSAALAGSQTAHLRFFNNKIYFFTDNGVWDLSADGMVTRSVLYRADWVGIRYWNDLNNDGITQSVEINPEHPVLVGLFESGHDVVIGAKLPPFSTTAAFDAQQSAWRNALGFWRARCAKLPLFNGRHDAQAFSVLWSAAQPGKRWYVLEGEYLTLYTAAGAPVAQVKVDMPAGPSLPGQLPGVSRLLGCANLAPGVLGEVVALADGQGAVRLLTSDGLLLTPPLPAGMDASFTDSTLLRDPMTRQLYLLRHTPAVVELWRLAGLESVRRTTGAVAVTAEDAEKAARALSRALGPK